MRKRNIISHIITAAIFIILEIAALTMIGNNGEVQNNWLSQISHGFTGTVWGGFQKIGDYFSLDDKNEELAKENYELLMEVAKLRDKVFSLDAEYEIPEGDMAGEFIMIPARISKLSTNTQHNYIILDKGSEDGVTEGSGVITRHGAIGIIDAVGESHSYARSFQNFSMSISARLGREGVVGTLTWDGTDDRSSTLKGIPHHIKLNPGDTVYTSGYSAIYPAGIPVGTIGEARIMNGSTYEIDVALLENYQSLRHVTIVINTGKEEIEDLESGL